jgi:hypothetical protein
MNSLSISEYRRKYIANSILNAWGGSKLVPGAGATPEASRCAATLRFLMSYIFIGYCKIRAPNIIN